MQKYVAGLDTNTLLQDVFDIAEEFDFDKMDERVEETIDRLLNKGILKRQYMEKQDEE